MVHRSESGSPQGGVISPLMSNIYLHEVLDKWWHDTVLPRLHGRAQLVRYADDFVLLFSNKDDALRVQDVLPKRFARFGLTLHSEKTRLVCFQPPGGGGSGDRPESFDFLGFTHYLGKSRRGAWIPKRKTAKDRMSRAVRAMNQWLRRVRHEPIRWQAAALRRKLTGHFNYYGIAGNSFSISRFRNETKRLWRNWLRRRSQRAILTWEKFDVLLQCYPLPSPRLRTRWAAPSAANP